MNENNEIFRKIYIAFDYLPLILLVKIPILFSILKVSDDDSEVFDTNVVFHNDKYKHVKKLKQSQTESSSENEFYESSDKLHELDVDIHNNKSCLDNLTACENIKLNDLSSPSIVVSYDKNKELKKNINKSENVDSTKKIDKTVNRGGKYNKKVAPKPPSTESKSPDCSEGTVKGTLILKPGIIKTTAGGKCKEIFLQSPKFRRRNKQYFTSPQIAFNASKMTLTTNLDKNRRLMMEKQSSCPSFFERNLLPQSRSEIDLNRSNLTSSPCKESSTSKMTFKRRLCVNLLRSKSFHMGGNK